jgi:pyruvate/2-oxoglutarate dehydrogenase complex dihydrolipoamide dehydrogenase (E3) component
MSPPRRYDLVIVGMGSAGTVAAEFAAEQLGLRVAAVERERVGGDCLWTGCVPSKTLLASARAVHESGRPEGFDVDLESVWRRIAAVQEEIADTDDDPERFRRMGVELVEGDAVVTGPHEVTVGERVLPTRFVLVCTGSGPAVPPVGGIDDVDVLTSENIFTLDQPPRSLVLLGGGPIGCEISQALTRLGIDVTLVEMADRLLARDEPSHAARLLGILRAEGVDVRLGRTAERVERVPPADGGSEGVMITLDDGETISAAGLFVATGRVPNTTTLGLERLGIDTRPVVTVDDRSRTSVRSVYVVGDASNRPDFTHVAAYDAVLAVRDMFLPGRGRAPEVVPWCTFTDPEVAHVGLTAAEAIDRHGADRVEVLRHDLTHSDRARTDGITAGEIAIVTARGRVVGGHAICPHAGELIHELALAIHIRLRLNDLAQMVHVYPTLSTGIGQLAAQSGYRTARRYRWLARVGRLRAGRFGR